MAMPPKKKSVDSLRKGIDSIDEKILKLLNDRARLATQIGEIKKAKKADLHARARELEVYERLARLNKGPFPGEAVHAVFREIMSASLALEGPVKVAYLGPKATYTHLACLKQFGYSATYVPVNGIKEVFQEVERGRVEYGVVPIENSTEGVVTHTLDLFVESPLKIVGEVLQEVTHHLMSRSGKMEEVKAIYSHPHAIAQCRIWLENHVPRIPIREVSSTAKAAEICLEDPSAAAIASELAVQLYGLKILERRIEDNLNNFTRFLIISRKSLPRTGHDKTSVMFTVSDRVGALHDILRPFAEHGINMTKIESRPSKKKVWEYIFFVDIEGHSDDKKVEAVLSDLKENCLYLKVLGSYPIAVEKASRK